MLNGPLIAALDSPATQVDRVIGRHDDFLEEGGSQALDGSEGGVVVRVGGDDDRGIESSDEWRESTAGLKGVTMAAESLGDLITDMPGIEQDMVGIPDAEVDVARFRAVCDDPEMIKWHQAPLHVTRHKADEME